MKIALYGKAFGSDYDELMRDVVDILSDNDVDIVIYKPFWNDIKHCLDDSICFNLFDGSPTADDHVDMLFSFGGDGTILDSVPLIKDTEIPVLGINTGNLGFLSSVSTQETRDAVRNIIEGNYEIERRSMIKIKDDENLFDGINYALNEISVLRENNGSLIIVHVYIDDKLLNTYWADGIILATPTGSTAYSMSVGGPIMTPNTDSFLITPIAAHNLSVRPVVIPDKSKIKIKVEGRCEKFALGLDSRNKLIDKSMLIEAEKTDFYFNMVKVMSKDFFGTIRSKLLWGNDVRN